MSSDHSVVIARSADDLFALTQDYGCRLEWDPFLKSAELMNGASAAGLGVKAYCIARSGLGMETEYVSFNPPHVCAVKMTRGPRLLASFAGSWRFEPMGEGKTRVVFRYQVRAQPAWLSWALTPFLSGLFARQTRKRLIALKTFAENHPSPGAAPNNSSACT